MVTIGVRRYRRAIGLTDPPTISTILHGSFDAVGFGFWLSVFREQAPESQAMKQAAADEVRHLLEHVESSTTIDPRA
jgi:hypothetical protein